MAYVINKKSNNAKNHRQNTRTMLMVMICGECAWDPGQALCTPGLDFASLALKLLAGGSNLQPEPLAPWNLECYVKTEVSKTRFRKECFRVQRRDWICHSLFNANDGLI